MAKFSRLFLGGVVGAGLAYLFSRKDVRRRLMGGGQAQLMAPEASGTNIPVTACAPMAAPAAAPEATEIHEPPVTAPEPVAITEPVLEPEIVEAPEVVDAPEAADMSEMAETAEMPETAVPFEIPETAVTPTAMDLEARIEETRREVAEQFEAPFAAPPAANTARNIEEAAEVEEAESVEETADAVEKEAVAKPELEAELTSSYETRPISAPETEEFADLRTPMAGEPTTAEPEIEEAVPATESGPAPSQLDREEMRRRIDETRARLKAKAFDALVSGETFIEPETDEATGGKRPEAGVDIDRETGEQIDRSLREED
jgi:hypothetical protein